MLWLGIHLPDLPLEAFTLREGKAQREGQSQWEGQAQWEGQVQWERSPDRDCPAEDRDLEIAPTHTPTHPRVVVEGSHVVLCDAAASAAGIAPGTTLATAHSIVQGLLHYRRSPAEELRRLRRLGELLYRFSSQIALVPPDGLVMEIGASLRLFGGVEPLTRDAAALCRDLGHRAACRSATTPLAALSLARAGTATLAEAPLQRVAIEPAHLSPAVLEQLANMGVHTLGQLLKLPTAGLAARFGRGLVDYLQRLTGAQPDPRRCLQPSTRFRRRLHLLSPLRSKQQLLAGPMTQLLTELQYWLVAHQLGTAQLRWQFAGAGRGDQPVALIVRFSRGQQRQQRFFEISRLELERTALPEEVISLALRAERLQPWQTGSQALFRYLPPGNPAGGQSSGEQRPGARRQSRDGKRTRAIATDASTTANRTARSPQERSTSRLSPGQLAELGELVDQLEARLGRGACWSLEALDQHMPEAAWRPVAPLRAEAAPARSATSSGRRPPLTAARAPERVARPVWLFEPPRPIDSKQLTLLRGPERIETGWWGMAGADEMVGAISRSRLENAGAISRSRSDKEEAVAIGRSLPQQPQQPPQQPQQPPQQPLSAWRDYYVARHENGAECWVFVDAGARWHLHGYFG